MVWQGEGRGQAGSPAAADSGRRGGGEGGLGSGGGVRRDVAPAWEAGEGEERGRPGSAVRRATQETKCGDEGRGRAGRA